MQRISDAEEVAGDSIARQIFDAIRLNGSAEADINKNVREAVAETIEKLGLKDKLYGEGASAAVRKVAEYAFALEGYIAGAYLEELSYKYFFEYTSLGGCDCILKTGYTSLITKLADEPISESIHDINHQTSNGNEAEKGVNARSLVRMNEPIVSVSACGDGTVSVQTKSGSEFQFDHVIVTTSVAVLQSSVNQKVSETTARDGNITFQPPLPMKKVHAINSIHLGTANKIAIEFEGEPFWNVNADWITVLHDNEEQRRQSFTSWMNLHKYTDAKCNALLAWASSYQMAHFVECNSDEVIVERCLQPLRLIHEKTNPGVPFPRVTRTIVTRWASNPYIRGSWSYLPVGVTGDEYDAMAEPVLLNEWIGSETELETTAKAKPVLCFAGEATHRYYYGTVHGAYLSGQREADRLIQYYNLLRTQQ